MPGGGSISAQPHPALGPGRESERAGPVSAAGRHHLEGMRGENTRRPAPRGGLAPGDSFRFGCDVLLLLSTRTTEGR